MTMEERTYRGQAANELETHYLVIGETDMAVYVPCGIWDEQNRTAVADRLIESRSRLQNFIIQFPDFAASHIPIKLPDNAPKEAVIMAEAAGTAGVGPMAAVAGYLAGVAGEFIIDTLGAGEVIVENGGDIYLAGNKERRIGIFAGEKNPFSGRLAVVISRELLPCGICTSSGTFGSSFSYGKADAAMVIAKNPALADAVATATANRVQGPQDAEAACQWAMELPGVLAAVVICGEALAAAGAIQLCAADQQ